MEKLTARLSLERELGQGQFGIVFLGTDPVHGRVAVKVITKAPQEPDTDWRERKEALLAEGQRLAQAEHANVLRVHQVVESPTEDAVLLVTEYCPAGSLQNRFERGPMNLDDVRRVATDVALGLQALHMRGMLHRDIKPANVLCDVTGAAKIGDFGLVTDKTYGVNLRLPRTTSLPGCGGVHGSERRTAVAPGGAGTG